MQQTGSVAPNMRAALFEAIEKQRRANARVVETEKSFRDALRRSTEARTEHLTALKELWRCSQVTEQIQRALVEGEGQ